MRAWFGLVLVAMLLVGGIAAYQGALEQSGDDRYVDAEVFSSPTGGELITVDQAGEDGVYFNDNVTVFNSNGEEMAEGTDYEWYGNGTFRVLAGGSLAGDTEGTIDYEYQQVTEEQQQQAEFVSTLFGNAGFVVLVSIVVITLAVARWAVA